MAKHVVLVDDDPDLRAILSLELQLQGYRVACFGNAEGALSACGETLDLAIVDYQLPGMDGLALLKRLRQCYPELPALIISSDCGVGQLPNDPALPVTRQLRKPFAFDRLIDHVKTLLK